MVPQNYQNLIELTSNMISKVAFGGGLKCLRKIYLNTVPHKEREIMSVPSISKEVLALVY